MLVGLLFAVKWTEHGDQCSLSVSAQTKPPASIRLEVEGTDFSSQLEDRSKGEFDEWTLAVPIAVAKQITPQVLAKLQRRNWLDFSIYTVGAGSVARSFSFSCRDERAIRWHVIGKKLVSFETFDRFDPPPDRLKPLEKGGFRWQRKTTYRFDESTELWKHGKKTWERYRLGDSPPGQIIRSAKDCPFQYLGVSTK